MKPGRALAGALALWSLTGSASGAEIVIVNDDDPGVGFNDETAAAPTGGNPGTTLGQQRLRAFERAAEIWQAVVVVDVEVRVRATFGPAHCAPSSATLGSAGTYTVFTDFDGAPEPNTWYHSALADQLAGVDLAPGLPDISANFNGDLDSPDCLGDRGSYYGFDGDHGADIDLMQVLLHEIGHGLGFSNFVNEETGSLLFGRPGIFSRSTRDTHTAKLWSEMGDAERLESATNTLGVVWDGPAVNREAEDRLVAGTDDSGRALLYSPNPIRSGSSISHWDPSATPPVARAQQAQGAWVAQGAAATPVERGEASCPPWVLQSTR